MGEITKFLTIFGAFLPIFVIFGTIFDDFWKILIFGILDVCFKFPVVKILRIQKEVVTSFLKNFYRWNKNYYP